MIVMITTYKYTEQGKNHHKLVIMPYLTSYSILIYLISL